MTGSQYVIQGLMLERKAYGMNRLLQAKRTMKGFSVFTM